jgi:hypothetical protein
MTNAPLLEFDKDGLPEIFTHLQNDSDPMTGVHFSRGLRSVSPDGKYKLDKREPHLGINKDPSHSDPIGIYVFPKKYVLNGELGRKGFFTSSKYFYIIKPIRSKCKILNLAKVTESEATKMLEKMNIPDHYFSNLDVGFSAGKKLWDAMREYIRDKLSHGKNNYEWNKLFKRVNINCIVDDGVGIIHSNEPYQIVYMEPNIFEVVYSNQTPRPIIKAVASVLKELPDYPKKRISSRGDLKYNIFKKGYPEFKVVMDIDVDHDNFKLNVHGTDPKIEPVTYTLNPKEVGERYGYKKFDREEVINIIKTANATASNTAQSHEHFDERLNFLKRISGEYRLKLKTDARGKIELNRAGFDKSANSPVTMRIDFWGNPIIVIERKKPYGRSNYYYYYEDKGIRVADLNSYSTQDIIKRLLDGLDNTIDSSSYDIEGKVGGKRFVKLLRDRVFNRRNK